MEINVKFTAIEWWTLKLHEAKDEKIEHKIKHAEKQLELAKVTHRNKTPLVQVIDSPNYPLENSRWKLFKTLIYGFISGLLLSMLFLSIKRGLNSL